MPESHNDTWVPTPEYIESHPGARDPDDCYGPMNPDAKKPATEAFVPEKWHMDPLGPGPTAATPKPRRTLKITIEADYGDDGKASMSNFVLYNNLDSDSQREAICKTIDALDDAFLEAFCKPPPPSTHVEQ